MLLLREAGQTTPDREPFAIAVAYPIGKGVSWLTTEVQLTERKKISFKSIRCEPMSFSPTCIPNQHDRIYYYDCHTALTTALPSEPWGQCQPKSTEDEEASEAFPAMEEPVPGTDLASTCPI